MNDVSSKRQAGGMQARYEMPFQGMLVVAFMLIRRGDQQKDRVPEQVVVWDSNAAVLDVISHVN